MMNVDPDESQLEAAAGAAGDHVIDAFGLLSNETRLAILLALWEAYDQHNADDTVAFSKLYDRIDVSDSGNFTYHLNKLVGHFIAETDDGYRLRNTGLKIVQAAIAGAGFEVIQRVSGDITGSRGTSRGIPLPVTGDGTRRQSRYPYPSRPPAQTGSVQVHRMGPRRRSRHERGQLRRRATAT